jgi:hypothetical protein
VIASVSLLALGAVGLQNAQAQLTAGSDKPWSLAGTLRGFYDDNYNTTPSQIVNGQNQRQGSFGWEVRPSGSIVLSDGPTTFTASYVYDFRYYTDRPPRKYDQAHDVELDLNHAFNERYNIEVQDSFVVSQEPDIGAGSSTTYPLRTDLSNIRDTGRIVLNGQLTERFGFLFSYSGSIYDYNQNDGNLPAASYTSFGGGRIPTTASLSAELDRIENLVTLEGHWKAFEQTTALLGYQFGATEFTSNEPLNPYVPGFGPTGVPILTPGGVLVAPRYSPSVRDDFSHYVYAGVQHAFRSDLTVSVKGGFQYMDYYNANEVPGSATTSFSPYADVSVNYAYMDGAMAILGFRHSHNATDQSITYTGTTAGLTLDQESSTVYLSVVHKLSFLSPRLTGTVTGQYQNATWNGGNSSLNGVGEDIYAAGVNLSYQVNRLVSTEIGYNFDYLSAGAGPYGPVYGGGYHRNRVYAGVTASF